MEEEGGHRGEGGEEGSGGGGVGEVGEEVITPGHVTEAPGTWGYRGNLGNYVLGLSWKQDYSIVCTNYNETLNIS